MTFQGGFLAQRLRSGVPVTPPDSGQRRRALLAYGLLLALATAGAIVAQRTHHPVTAALTLMVAIIANGASGGLAIGLVSGACAAFFYNFFIRFPIYQFGFSSVDDFVPFVAFSVAATISGVLSGQLKDRAQAAERANGQRDLLLSFSARLQRALRLGDVVVALGRATSRETIERHILPSLEQRHAALLTPKWRAALTGAGQPDRACDGVMLHADMDMDAVVDLLAMAIERCDLLDQRGEAEVIRRSEEFKTALLSSLSHDLRTPIAAIAAAASGLERYGALLDADAREDMLSTIQTQCGRLDRFTAKLLSIGQLQQGIARNAMEIVDMAEPLGSAIAQVRALQPERPINKDLQAGAVLVLANPVMLEQVLFNVIENAVNYTDAEVPIRVSVSTGDGSAVIAVTDDGRGIAPGDLPHIFDRFYRSAGNREKVGQGLGLSIARGFVEAFGGRIDAISPVAAGRGTCIRITLPLSEAPTHG